MFLLIFSLKKQQKKKNGATRGRIVKIEKKKKQTLHITAGIFQYLLIPPGGKGTSWIWYIINLGVHFAWELFENSPCIIVNFRKSGIDPKFSGDSVVNSFADLICMTVGYWIAWLTFDYSGMWYLVLIPIILLQMVSCAMGSGMLTIAIQTVKYMFGYVETPENGEGNDEEKGLTKLEKEKDMVTPVKVVE